MSGIWSRQELGEKTHSKCSHKSWDQLENLKECGIVIWQRILMKQDARVWIELNWLQSAAVAASCKHDRERRGSIRGGKCHPSAERLWPQAWPCSTELGKKAEMFASEQNILYFYWVLVFLCVVYHLKKVCYNILQSNSSPFAIGVLGTVPV